MPTYDYKCKNCGYEFEKFQPITARSLRKCPACGKNTLNRLIGTGAAVIFKGSGFYATDYRSESYNKGKKAETKSSEKKTDAPKTEKAKSKTTDKSRPESKPKPKTT